VADEELSMRLFVTGGAGFIGSNYVRHVLATTDDHVTVFDALTYAGTLDNLRGVDGDPRFTFVKGDICDREAVTQAMDGHDAVVHFAAESHVDRSIVDPDAFVRTNCDGTNVVCDVARRVGVERVLHISTDEVYGSIEEGSFTEESPLSPRSPYSASKAGSDLIALSYHTTYGLPVLVTRSSNNFGPHQFPEKVIPLFVTNLLEGRKVPLYGDGGNVRDWCYVADNCAAVDLVLRKGEVGEVYNIGAGNEITNRELTHKLLALTGRDESFIEPVADRPGHDRRYSITTTKVEALGWRPARDLDDALADTVAWYRDNRWWWEPLKQRAAFDRFG
jgi:dTDP-glucose 4,6-dehydratase